MTARSFKVILFLIKEHTRRDTLVLEEPEEDLEKVFTCSDPSAKGF